MKLALYSDQIVPENRRIDDVLLRLLPPGSTIGFVPSAGDPDRRWAASRREYYGSSGLNLVCSYDPAEHDLEGLDRLLACDAIHLSGGDTRVFQQRLNDSGVISVLRDYAADGGVLIGTSAGAILLGEDIAVDALFHSEAPRPGGPKGLGLVDFDFFPHLRSKPEFLPALAAYSRTTSRPVLGCPDGAGVIVNGEQIELVGDGLMIFDGVVSDWHEWRRD